MLVNANHPTQPTIQSNAKHAKVETVKPYTGTHLSLLVVDVVKIILSFATYGESARLNRTCKKMRSINLRENPFLHFLCQREKPKPRMLKLHETFSNDYQVKPDHLNHQFIVVKEVSYSDSIKNCINIVRKVQREDGMGLEIIHPKIDGKINPASRVEIDSKVFASNSPNIGSVQGWDLQTGKPINWLNKIQLATPITDRDFSKNALCINGCYLFREKFEAFEFSSKSDSAVSFHYDDKRQRATISTDEFIYILDTEKNRVIVKITRFHQLYRMYNVIDYFPERGWLFIEVQDANAENTVVLSINIIDVETGEVLLEHKFNDRDSVVTGALLDPISCTLWSLVDVLENLEIEKSFLHSWQIDIKKWDVYPLYTKSLKRESEHYSLEVVSRSLSVFNDVDLETTFWSIDDHKMITTLDLRRIGNRKLENIHLGKAFFSIHALKNLEEGAFSSDALIRWDFNTVKSRKPLVNVNIEILET